MSAVAHANRTFAEEMAMTKRQQYRFRLELVVSPLESMFFALTTDVELDPAGLTDLIEAAMAQT